MAKLRLPEDKDYLAAFGKVAVAHGHLELVQRWLVRTFANIDMVEALNCTESLRAKEVRQRVRKLAKQRQLPEQILCRLDALLERARVLSNDRNDLLHRTVQADREGNFVQKGVDQRWGPAPQTSELEILAKKITELVDEINTERLEGFIRDACQKYKMKP